MVAQSLAGFQRGVYLLTSRSVAIRLNECPDTGTLENFVSDLLRRNVGFDGKGDFGFWAVPFPNARSQMLKTRALILNEQNSQPRAGNQAFSGS
jgi:hypothetical protein